MYHVHKKGYKTIAKELKISKNTVKKIIKEDATKQHYARKSQPYTVLANYKEELESKLEYDKNEPARRRRTAKKIYDEIVLKGYEGSYEAVNNFIKAWKVKEKIQTTPAFIPLEFSQGEAFQFDWSLEEIELDGAIARIKVAHIRLCYSRFFLLIAYPNEQLEMVMDAHDKAFHFFGGSCRQGTYDNMKTAVKKILIGKDRNYNERFLQMASHHLFEPVACTPASGWEKGQVENQVCTGRRNFFSPLVRVKTLEQLNQQLQQDCIEWAKKTQHPENKEKKVWEMYEDEKASLIPYRGAFDACKLEPTSVSSTCLVNFDTNSYSVECQYARKPVEMRIYADQIKVYYEDELIGKHARSFEHYKKIYNPWHYLSILERKPGALRHGAPFKEWRLPNGLEKVRTALSKHKNGDKEFITILLEIQTFGLDAVNDACTNAIANGISQAEIILNALKCTEVKDNSHSTIMTTIPLKHPPSDDFDAYNQITQSSNIKLVAGGSHGA